MVADIPIMLAVLTMGLFNYYLIERTERKAFLEIRTCIESRHTIAKENQQQVWNMTRLAGFDLGVRDGVLYSLTTKPCPTKHKMTPQATT